MAAYVIALEQAHLIDQEGRQPRLTETECLHALSGLETLGHRGRVRVVELREGRPARVWLDTVLTGARSSSG